MRKPIATPLTATSTLIFAVAFTACGTAEPASQSPSAAFKPLDPPAATLDQILERTRAAMSKVTSYRTRGTVDSNLPQTGPSLSNEFFTEWQYPDRRRNQAGPLQGEGESGFVTEYLSVGVQSFARLNGSTCEEQPLRPNNEAAHRSY